MLCRVLLSNSENGKPVAGFGTTFERACATLTGGKLPKVINSPVSAWRTS